MCITLRICCLLVKQVISKIIDSTYQERMKYLFKGQKNWIPCRMKAVFTAKVLGWICSPLIYSAYPRAWLWIGLKWPTKEIHRWNFHKLAGISGPVDDLWPGWGNLSEWWWFQLQAFDDGNFAQGSKGSIFLGLQERSDARLGVRIRRQFENNLAI